MTYTPVELRHVRVGRSLLGYNRAMVEQMIEEVAESFEATWRERGELADRVEVLEKQIVELRRREELLTHTLVAAEEAASNVRDQARRTAEAILAEAQQEARAVLRAAQAQRERLTVESRRIEGMLRAALVMVDADSFPAALDSTPPEGAPVEPVAVESVPLEPAPGASVSSTAPPVASAPSTPAVAVPASPPPPPSAPPLAPEPAASSSRIVHDPEPGPFEHAPVELERPPADPELEGWPLEDTGEYKPVSLPPAPPEDRDPGGEPEGTPLLRRLAGGSSRDFDWGD